jgi:TetR/AcrR family tetracycline transcriptional repressor
MRKLAQALGVEAMSLYNHVRDKDALLGEIANLVVSRIPLPNPALPWRARVEALVLGLYGTLVSHPHVLMLLANEKVLVTHPQALAVMEAAACALASSGLAQAQQVSAFRGLIALCFGFVLAHTRGLISTRTEAEAIWGGWDHRQWADTALPSLSKLAPQFLKTRANDDLDFTLRTYLDALERGAA